MRLATQPLRKFSHNSGGKIRTEFFNTQLDARRNCIPLAPGLLRRDPQPLSQPLCLCGDWLGGPDRTASSRCDQVIGPGWQRTSGTLRNLQPHAVASADDRLRAQISHVHVGSSLCVVEQVPAEMVGTLVDGIVIAPVPAPSPHSWASPKPASKKNSLGSQKHSRGSPAGLTDCSCRACGGRRNATLVCVRLVMRLPLRLLGGAVAARGERWARSAGAIESEGDRNTQTSSCPPTLPRSFRCRVLSVPCPPIAFGFAYFSSCLSKPGCFVGSGTACGKNSCPCHIGVPAKKASAIKIPKGFLLLTAPGFEECVASLIFMGYFLSALRRVVGLES
jgi:hypothetical protein